MQLFGCNLMASVFCLSEKKKYWIKYETTHASVAHNHLYFGVLRYKKSGEFVTNDYNLTSTALIQLNAQGLPKKFVYINWKTLDPFYEENETGNQYGFQLGTKFFYVNSSKQLDIWLLWLKRVTILTTFEEDYIIIKEIGIGSTCKVYLVHDIETKKEYAAKCIEKSYFSDHKLGLRNVIQEIKTLFALNHPFIAKLYYVYETPDCVYMIMDYFPNGDLFQRIKVKKTFSGESCARFAKNMIDVLDYLHSKSIVHRDIKLENIMMTSNNDYEFKLIDFGLSYESTQNNYERCGSPGYIAPEVLNNFEYSSKIDVFSAGVVLYILITGNHPFNARNSEKILERNRNCVYNSNSIQICLLETLLII